MTKSILLAGVGGQGTILVSNILTIGLMEFGYDIKTSEIHGMSQRGGTVSTHIRYGNKIYSPVIERGGADLLVSFEKMEAIRYLKYLNPKGKIIVNNYKIRPLPVLIGKVNYPEEDIDKELNILHAITVDAESKANEIGNIKVMNLILLGVVVELLNLNDINWEDIIRKNIKENFIDINIRAFHEGIKLIKEK
ncbi:MULTISPECIES: indolepyruvate oxidoreductase subunit beta [unclassified Romboutsia]|uniref:indolepyruvate oxidoreductase subunit beta n=1 Tax=unclassified Romboutsia TaxID=2626894 RepID=UPI000821082D|nr:MULTISPECIES: indolepyruvate oxidoreductase subunit beta [unclassified Romboutsia]SCH39192.1 indolepyruvate oxidoreductase subunit beta [uncultured Clostridium sp.]